MFLTIELHTGFDFVFVVYNSDGIKLYLATNWTAAIPQQNVKSLDEKIEVNNTS